ncbi:MAG TPA: nuclease A inhibitor family protein [Blastocatellia bacterium]|nr:nuclease A inhibitor family protein [Blastocatellia bacterium]
MTRDEFDSLADGLLLMSESDAPLTYFELPEVKVGEWPPATSAQFLKLIGETQDTPVREIAAEKFFAALAQGNEDLQAQVKKLQQAFARLKDLKCYRVGEIEIEIYLLGRDAAGKICGLQTLSVET